MASGLTNKGKLSLLIWALCGDTIPTNFYIALVSDTPDAETDLMSDLTEITAGNGYTAGGYQITPNHTDWDVRTEDDTGNTGYIQLKDIEWLASGGTIPSADNDATYAVLIDDDATVDNREVYAYWDLGGSIAVTDGNKIKIEDMRITGA